MLLLLHRRDLAVACPPPPPPRLPRQRFFGFVEAVSEDAETLLEGLGEQSYETKTRGGCQRVDRAEGACWVTPPWRELDGHL